MKCSYAATKIKIKWPMGFFFVTFAAPQTDWLAWDGTEKYAEI
jgi:hypothetical protein